MTSSTRDNPDPAGTSSSGRVIYITLDSSTGRKSWEPVGPVLREIDVRYGEECEKVEPSCEPRQEYQTRKHCRVKQHEPLWKRVARRRAREKNRKAHNKIIQAARKKKEK